MEVYKRYSTALEKANGGPILRIGHKLYIVGSDLNSVTAVEIINGDGLISATVGLGHLERHGNLNHILFKLPVKDGRKRKLHFQ